MIQFLREGAFLTLGGMMAWITQSPWTPVALAVLMVFVFYMFDERDKIKRKKEAKL